MKKIIAIIICIVLTTSAVMSLGCNCGGNKENGGGGEPGINGVKPIEGESENIKANETEKFIAKDGETDYTILVSASATEETLFAVQEMNYFMNLSAGVTFPIKRDAGVEIADNSKYLIIGKTEQSEKAGIKYEFNELGTDGYKIKTINQCVFLGGNSGNGDIFAVYKFLNVAIGYEFYSAITIEYDKKTQVKLYDYDVVDIPDYKLRITGTSGWQSGTYNVSTVKRYRNDLTDEVFIHPSELNGYGHFHNSIDWLNPSVYSSENPKWYSADLGELCYTAHGDKEAYEKMQNELLERIKIACKKQYLGTNINISIEDYGSKCSCGACMAELNKYNGCYSAMIIKFMNDMERKVNAWIKTNTDNLPQDRTYTIQFFAYMWAVKPPLQVNSDGSYKRDANGNYIPIDDSVICNDNVIPFFAPLTMQNFVDSIDDVGGDQKENYLAWKSLAKRIDVWFYGCYFNDYASPYVGMNGFVENARYLNENKTNGLFLYEYANNSVESAFFKLTGYVAAKTSWNTKLSTNDLVDNYFYCAFGPAQTKMRLLYNEIMTYMITLQETGVMSKKVQGTVNADKKDIWTEQILNKWLNKINEAYAEIESVKDSEKYQRYYDEITSESIFIRYLLIKLYSSSYSGSQLNDMKKTLLADMNRLGNYVVEGYNPWEKNYPGVSAWRDQIY